MKKLLKRIGIVFVVLFVSIIGLALIDGSNDEDIEEVKIEESINNVETEVEEVESFDIEDEKNKLYKVLDKLCETSFTANNIEYEIEINDNDKMILITQYCEGLSEDLTNLIIADDLSSWASLIENMEYSNNEFAKLISDFKAFKDYDVCFELYSEVDGKDTIFASTVNGLVLFDMVDALGIEY